MGESNKSQASEEIYRNVALTEGRFLSHPSPGDEIVISGVSGMFPEVNNMHEYANKLFNKTAMVTPSHRWIYEHPEMPNGSGNIPSIESFDAGFFGNHERQAQSLDSMSRLIQERAIEAIFDAGLNPKDLENTRTGVFIGVCFSETEKIWLFDKLCADSQAYTGVARSMMAHRISYFLKLKGPSFTNDSACSSSLFSLEHAYRALRLRQIDAAIVGGVNVCTRPFVTLQFVRLGVLSPDGQSKVFDKKGNGYARSEAVGALFLQRKCDAKRVYTEIVHAKTNSDGFKPTGLTFPSREAQRLLLQETYDESQINPINLIYVETHGTGTIVGDPEECAAIDDVLTEGRKTPLLIGSVKSNMGHSEAASGVCSIAKCIITMETGLIPPNINFEEPKEEIYALKEGRLKVVTEKTTLDQKPALLGVSSFGFGGGNCHVILKQHEKDKVNCGIPDDNLPRLVCISGRTKEAVLTLMDSLKNNRPDAEYIRLFHDIFSKNVSNHIYRGYSIITKSGELCRFFDLHSKNRTPFYLCSGELTNWCNIGNKLLSLPPFSNSLHRIQKVLLKSGINIIDILHNSVQANCDKYHILGGVAVQIGIIDTLKEVKLKPVDHFGYSYGKLLPAYASGVLDLQDTISCALVINENLNRVNSIYCNSNTITNQKILNGNADPSLNLNTMKSALKSSDLSMKKKDLVEKLHLILKTKKIENGSPEYFCNALINDAPVNIEIFETDALILNIGTIPITKNNEDVKIFSLFPTENRNSLIDFLRVLGNLYLNGHNGQLDKLYPKINYPVSRGTGMISPHIKWNHNRKWFTPKFESEVLLKAQQGSSMFKIQLSNKDWEYIGGHVVDGRHLFPATGYLCLVWETLAVLTDFCVDDMSIVFEDCKFLRATTFSSKGTITFNITVHPTGKFEIMQGDSAVVTGRIKQIDDVSYGNCDAIRNERIVGIDEESMDKFPLKNKDIYKELRLRGYNYSKDFRSIQLCNVNATKALVRWSKNWVTFMDNMLQLKILQTDTRLLFVPTYISKLTIQGKKHKEWMNAFRKPDKPLDLPVHYNPITENISSGYIQISGLLASSINRRKDLGIPVLETYSFVPNSTSLLLEESVRINMQIILENALIYKVKTIELIDDFTTENTLPLSPIIQSVLEDQPLIKPFLTIYSNVPLETAVPVETIKPLDSETDNVLVIVSKILQRPQVLHKAVSALKENGFIISREPPNFEPLEKHDPPLVLLTVHKTSSETLVLMQKVRQTSEPLAIKIESNNFAWIDELKKIIKSKTRDNVILYSEDEPTSGILGLVNCLRREPESAYIRCVFLMDQSSKYDPLNPSMKEQIDKNLAVNVFKDGVWGTYRHLLYNKTTIKETEHCFVNSLVKGDLSSLKWIEGTLKYDSELPAERSLVFVHYSALNFRDIMVASARINVGSITIDRLMQDSLQGFEFSGIKNDGTRVTGMSIQSLSTLIEADDYWTFDVPDSVSLAAAATVPVVYATVIYSLLIRSKLKGGETILIHSGTGGIGQAAIRVALHYGCTIFTTVGSIEKKEYLKKLFPQLKDSHIGNSRNLSFEHLIKRKTRGRGVDIVLNSLAEDKLLASVRCLAKKGRLIEIGKFDMANDNQLNLLLFKKSASFQGIMLDRLFFEVPQVKKQIGELMEQGLREGWIQPIDRTIFKYSEIEEAFRFMASGKHVGKVLLEVRPEVAKFTTDPSLFPCIARFCCDPSKSYVIVGGLGGFGLELADWLVLRGARKLILTSRNGISTGYQNLRIKTWMRYGVEVHILKMDVTTKIGCNQLLREAEKIGAVDVIFNLAVVLADALFENQTQEFFKTSFGPKAFATVFLDEESRKLCTSLRNFVIFSSVSCGRGNAGQTNYGMANSIMERICEKRKSEGYPALAIQWGAIGEVGLVAELQEESLELEIGGTLPQKISNCLNVLDKFLIQSDSVIVSSMVVAEKRGGADAVDNMVDAVINILGLQDVKSISLHATLAELGMDSMSAVEIKQTLERNFEVFLSAKEIRTMTLMRLKEIQEEKLTDSGQSDIEITSTANLTLDTLLSKSLSQNSSSEILIRLESQVSPESNAPTIIYFPGIEGQSVAFDNLASLLKAHIFSLHYPLVFPINSIQDLVDILFPIVLKCVPKSEPFKFIAHSYGTILALEVANRLENEGYFGDIVLLDGSPALIKSLSDNLSTKTNWETGLILTLLKTYGLTDEDLRQHEENFQKCSNWEERVNLASIIIKHKTNLDENHQKALANGFHQKIQHLQTYQPSYNKIKSSVLLLKASLTKSDLSEDYELSTVLETSAKVEVINTNHADIFDNELSCKVLKSWLAECTRG